MPDANRPRQAATQLLNDFYASQPGARGGPTPVDALAETLGLDIAHFSAEMHPGTLGFLEPGEPLIFLRAGMPETLRRFTLAHEIGHAILHRAHSAYATPDDAEEACDDADLDAIAAPDDLADETLLAGQAYSARARREGEANAFAAALLLPTDALIARYTAPDALTVHETAAHFGISEDVLLRRLVALLRGTSEPVEDVSAAMREPARRPLDNEQRAAAESGVPALVVAGPGTGKTTALLARAAYLMRERGVPPERILALTFSRRAASELGERLDSLLREDAATANARRPTVSTLHAFCGDLLRRYGYLVGLRPDFRLVGEAEGYLLLRALSSTLELRHYQPVTAPAMYFPDLLGAVSRAKDELLAPEHIAERAQAQGAAAATAEEREAAEKAAEFAAVYAAYQARLAERGDPDFGDLIRLSVQLLLEQPDVLEAVRAEHEHILVDEFQDINRAMGVLLRILAGSGGALWAVGDPDQAIYRFRGASPANLARFTEEYPSAEVHRLTNNYRSRPAIVAAANTFADAALGSRERAGLRPTRADDAPGGVRLAHAVDEACEEEGLACQIVAQAARGRRFAEQAVLCRTRRQVERIAGALKRRGLPVRVIAPLLDQPEVKDVLAVVALQTESGGHGLLRAGNLPGHRFARADALAVLAAARARGVALGELLGAPLADIPHLSSEGAEGLARLAAALVTMRAAPDVATGLSRYLFDATPFGRDLLTAMADGGDDAVRLRALHLSRLIELARAFDDQRRAAGTAPMHAAWADFLDYVRVLLAVRGATVGDTALATADDGVWVLTAHASKGLEFPVVYLPGLANGRFPSIRQRDAVPVREGDGDGAEDDAHLTEEACLFFVAMTRARDELILSVADRYGRKGYKPSPFLAPLATLPHLSHEDWTERGAVAAAAETTALPADIPIAEDYAAPLSVSALETYQRCPRQFAYRYVYQLDTKESYLLAMRRTVLDTLHELVSSIEAGAPAPTPESSRDLFEQRWTQAVLLRAPEASAAGTTEPASAESAYAEVYRRHGRTLIENMWAAVLRRQESPPDAVPREDELPTFERQADVSFGGHTVRVVVDRVESVERATSAPATTGRSGASKTNGAAADTTGATGATGATEAAAARVPTTPVRLVRHQFRQGARPDLRSLLYKLAAEQGAFDGRPADIYQQDLRTGEQTPVKLTARQADRLREDLIDALDGIARRDFAPRPDPYTCQSCPFLLICPS